MLVSSHIVQHEGIHRIEVDYMKGRYLVGYISLRKGSNLTLEERFTLKLNGLNIPEGCFMEDAPPGMFTQSIRFVTGTMSIKPNLKRKNGKKR